MEILSKQAIVEGLKLHFRTCGSGPPLILLHASPMSSAAMIPLIKTLSDNYTVIALDTPGYGYSEPLKKDPKELADYVDVLHQFISQLDIDSVAIYGTATGAQLAIRYGLKYKKYVSQLFLDNTAHFTDEEIDAVLLHYFPDLSIRENGSHLSKIWEIGSNMFQYFPWCFHEEKYALNIPPMPLSFVHSICRDFVWCGAGYDKAYKLAFAHEKVDFILELEVPCKIIRWEGSIVKPYTDRIFERQLPANVGHHIIHKEEDRYGQIKQLINTEYPAESYSAVDSLNTFETLDHRAHEYDLEALGSFPELDAEGNYWIKAWDKIKEAFPSMSIKKMNKVLYHWSLHHAS